MSIVTVDRVDGNVMISFDDGTTAIYEEAQLRTLKPIEVIHGVPGITPSSPQADPGSPVNSPGRDGH